MFTTCPKCSLTLVVTTTDLRAAQGFVRCGRCSNVFNALANLSENRQNAPAPSASLALSAPAESGTPEESPRYEEAPSPQPARGMPPPSAPAPPAPPRPAARQQPSSALQQQPAFAPRGLPPPTAEDLDDIPEDISLEFDASSADISQVFVQQPARRLIVDGSTGTFETLALTEPVPQQPAEEAPVDTEFEAQLRALASQLNPALQPAPQPQQLIQPTRTAPAPKTVTNAPVRDTGATGTNPVLRRPPASEPAATSTRPVQSPPVRESPPPQVRQSAPPQNRETPQPVRPVAKDPSATGANPVLRLRQPVSDTPVADEEPVVRQTTGAPAVDTPQPAARQTPALAPDPTPMARQTTGGPTGPTPDSVPTMRQAAEEPGDDDLGDFDEADETDEVDDADDADDEQPIIEQPPVRQTSRAPAREATASRQGASQTQRRGGNSSGVEAAATSRRSPEELIQAAAAVVRAGRRRMAPSGTEMDYADNGEPALEDVNIVPDISESFPNRIRRRALRAIEGDRAALRVRMPSLSWSTGAVLLSAFFVAQVINHYRNELATSDRLRKPLTSFYRTVGVPIVPRWDVGAYEVRQLGALAGLGPDNKSQLTVRLSVKNGAKSAQPVPYLRVTVQDRFGNRVAARDVPPKVYAPKRSAALLAADQRIDAEIAFVDPGQSAVGFEIDACLPTASGRIACANDQIAR